MATLDQAKSQVAAAVLALPGGTKTRLPSDYLETERVVAGEVGVQVRASLTNVVYPDSAVTAEAAQIEVVMARRLGIAESERAYADGDMVADQSALVSRGFWEGLAAVRQVVDDSLPGVSLQPERRGPIFVYSVIADVVLQP